MNAEDEKRFRLIIREEVQRAMQDHIFTSAPSTPLCGDPSFQQRSAALDEQRRKKEAKLANKPAKRKKRQEAA